MQVEEEREIRHKKWGHCTRAIQLYGQGKHEGNVHPRRRGEGEGSREVPWRNQSWGVLKPAKETGHTSPLN